MSGKQRNDNLSVDPFQPISAEEEYMNSSSRVRALVALFVLSTSVFVHAQKKSETSREKFYRKAVENCNPTSYANNKDWYFGETNSTGPGSVFGIKGGTTNPVANANAYFSPAALANAIHGLDGLKGVATCTDDEMPSWSVSWGLPIDITGIGNATITGSITHSNNIKVKIDQTWVESMDSATFEDALDKIDHGTHEYTDAVNGKSYFMSSAVAVKGLTITFTLTNALSVTAQGDFAVGKTVNLGTASNPANVKVTVGNAGKTVTITADDKTYILGRLLKIDKIEPKNQVAHQETTNGVAANVPSVHSHVQATIP